MLKKRTGNNFLSHISPSVMAVMSKNATALNQISSMRTLAERLWSKFKIEPTEEVVDDVENLIESIASSSLEPQVPLLSYATALLPKHRS
jgi:hypothetical protein